MPKPRRSTTSTLPASILLTTLPWEIWVCMPAILLANTCVAEQQQEEAEAEALRAHNKWIESLGTDSDIDSCGKSKTFISNFHI